MVDIRGLWVRLWCDLPEDVREGPLTGDGGGPRNQTYDLFVELFPTLPSRLRQRRLLAKETTSQDRAEFDAVTSGCGELLTRASKLAATFGELLEEIQDSASVKRVARGRSRSGVRGASVSLLKTILKKRGLDVLDGDLTPSHWRGDVQAHFLTSETEPNRARELTAHILTAWADDAERIAPLGNELRAAWAATDRGGDPVGQLEMMKVNPLFRDFAAEKTKLAELLPGAMRIVDEHAPHSLESWLELRDESIPDECPRLTAPFKSPKPRPLQRSLVERLCDTLRRNSVSAQPVESLIRAEIDRAVRPLGLRNRDSQGLLVIAGSMFRYPLELESGTIVHPGKPKLVRDQGEPPAEDDFKHPLHSFYSELRRRFLRGRDPAFLTHEAREKVDDPLPSVGAALWARLHDNEARGNTEEPILSFQRAVRTWIAGLLQFIESPPPMPSEDLLSAGHRSGPADMDLIAEVLTAMCKTPGGRSVFRRFMAEVTARSRGDDAAETPSWPEVESMARRIWEAPPGSLPERQERSVRDTSGLGQAPDHGFPEAFCFRAVSRIARRMSRMAAERAGTHSAGEGNETFEGVR